MVQRKRVFPVLAHMILNGLGGRKYSEQHAVNTALLMNELQPEYVLTLVVAFPMGSIPLRQEWQRGL